MTDWREAGLRADARRVQRLWVAPFDNPAKDVVRRRVAEVLSLAGGTMCLDLGGGGSSAKILKDRGLSVISVENGSLRLEDRGYPVSATRKRRAHELICEEIGVEARWGQAHQFMAEADVAFLDFCGPWSESVRIAIAAGRHMKAIAVTLTTGHDIYTQATTQRERQLAYFSWLRDAYRNGQRGRMPGQGREVRQAPCRLIAEYKTDSGHPVWVFLLAASRISIPHLNSRERRALHPEQSYREQTNARNKWRWKNDPVFRARRVEATQRWLEKKKAA